MGFVVDESGDLQGVVISTKLLEARVIDPPEAGELSEAALHGVKESSWTLEGRLPVQEVRRILGLKRLMPGAGSRYYTLAGFILELLRRLPQPGDTALWEGLMFEVTKMDGFRIDQVVVRSRPKADVGSDHSSLENSSRLGARVTGAT
jgi:putative hemolysin